MSNSFCGEFHCKIDAKGRMSLPNEFRKNIADTSIIVTRGVDKNIEIYTKNDWNILKESTSKLDLNKSKNRKYIHFLFSGASEVEIDSQGRINLPNPLISFSQLEKEVVVVGNMNTIQIWNKKKWEEYMDETFDEIDDIMENINEE